MPRLPRGRRALFSRDGSGQGSQEGSTGLANGLAKLDIWPPTPTCIEECRTYPRPSVLIDDKDEIEVRNTFGGRDECDSTRITAFVVIRMILDIPMDSGHPC